MITSSITSSGQNLAAWPNGRLLNALQELANIRDDGGGVLFLRRFPDFVSIGDTGWLAKLLRNRGQDASATSIKFFETLREVDQSLLPTPESHVRVLSEIIREIWRGTSEGMRALSALLMVDDVSQALKLLVALRQMQNQPGNVLPWIFSLFSVRTVTERLKPDWTRQGRFRYEAVTRLQKALYALWAKSSFAKVCKNPDCNAPFFIARRLQVFCSDDCAAPFRLEAKMRWWNKVGKKRRDESLKKSKKRGKR
jgi:hypothetical protein